MLLALRWDTRLSLSGLRSLADGVSLLRIVFQKLRTKITKARKNNISPNPKVASL